MNEILIQDTQNRSTVSVVLVESTDCVFDEFRVTRHDSIEGEISGYFEDNLLGKHMH